MSKEQYVTYETARLLKEKGFDWECRAYWHEDDRELIESQSPCYLRNITNPCWFGNTAPTQQMAMRWLREERGIHIYPIPVTGFHYVVSVYAENGNKVHNRILSRSGRHAYEDAVDAALEYCLTNLI